MVATVGSRLCVLAYQMAPFGVELGSSPLQLLRLVQQQPSSVARSADQASRRNSATRTTGRDLLAAFLGPSCQTVRQFYGTRGRWLTYLIFFGGALALLGWPFIWSEARNGGVSSPPC